MTKVDLYQGCEEVERKPGVTWARVSAIQPPTHLAECLHAGLYVFGTAPFACKEEPCKEATIADEGCVELEEVGTQIPSKDLNDVADDRLTLGPRFCVQPRDRLEVAWSSCFREKRCFGGGACNEALLYRFAYNVV